MKKMPPTDRKICGKPECNDWMYHAGLVPADQVICGACKIRIGRMAIDGLVNSIRVAKK